MVLLTACGGGSDSSSSEPVDTLAPNVTVPAGLTVPAGGSLDFVIEATDSGGFGTTTVTCDQGSLAATTDSTVTSQTVSVGFGAPATEGFVACMVVSTDAAGNSETLDFEIEVTPPPVDTATFNGTWFSPCYNNGFGFSVRQTLTINGPSLESFIESFTAGATPAQNCILPAEGLLVTTDVVADLDFQFDLDVPGCVNDRGVNTAVNIQTVDTSGNPTATTEQEITDTLNLVTGFTDILPASTDMCVLTNGNLSFAGVEYTDTDGNPNIISPDFDLTADVSWSLGENDFMAATSASTESTVTNNGVTVVTSVPNPFNDQFGGSVLSLSHPLNGSGVYQVTTTAGLVQGLATDPSALLVDVNATVTGTSLEDTSSSRYEAVETAGFVVVIVDDAGVYHFSTEADLLLERTLDVEGGVSGAPDTINLSMSNVFDFQE